jgi:hypothetical protein
VVNNKRVVFGRTHGTNHLMNRLAATTILLLLALAISLPAFARPGQGFNHGPYLDIEAGISEAKFDHDQTIGADTTRDYEPSFGFMFGWNAWDWLSAELQGRYSTDRNAGRREHLAAANLYAKFFLITDALTDFPTLRILPFAKAGMSLHVDVLPGSVNASDSNKITTMGYGPSIGAGIAVTWKKYVHFGMDIQEDLLFYEDKRQTVSGVPNTLVYKGGFYPSLAAMGFIGVHY